MRPDEDELDDEIRGHLAISIMERVQRGEDPKAARLAALKEFGNVTLTRESMRGVWRHRLLDSAAALRQDIRVALRSLARVRGLAATVIITLALGIGANAAIFSVVHDVLLRPLTNRDEDRLLYIRQSAPGVNIGNTLFSVPEVDDFKARAKTISAFGDFSVVDFTMIGLEPVPRVVQAGVVGGSYFEVMGLRPVLGRLLDAGDDGPNAEGVVVLTHRFWSTALQSDPSVIGKAVRLDTKHATVVGVLEPSVPYPAETEIIANVVTSPHHLGATMVTLRSHRMTELFGRLAPGATVDDARAELAAIHADMKRAYPKAYAAAGQVQVSARPLREQITAPARTVLLLLLGAAAMVFVIACSNVANLILARSVRREGELAVRAALGASTGALRRTLLAESLVLCSAGAVLGVLLAGPLVSVIGRYAARFSVRALDVAVDTNLLWVGAALAIVAAVVLAYIPRLPSPEETGSTRTGIGLAAGVRLTPATNRRLRVFAITQIALSFVLLAGAGMLLATLIALRTAETGYNLRQVLALDVPITGRSSAEQIAFYQDVTTRIEALPGVQRVSVANVVPWRDARITPPEFPLATDPVAADTLAADPVATDAVATDAHTPADDGPRPYARIRIVTPGFFAVLGVPMIAGRDFTAEDRNDSERVVIVSQSVAQRLFPTGDAIGHRVHWVDPVFGPPEPRRIIGVVADVDDEHVVPGPARTVYHPLTQLTAGGRLFVHATGDPYALVAPIREIIRDLSTDQVVERAATLADVRAEVLAPQRLNAFVFSAFAGVALLIAVVGVAGVLAFSVSARTREFGVRLAIGSTPRALLTSVLSEGAVIAAIGTLAGAVFGVVVANRAVARVEHLHLDSVLPLLAAAAVLIAAAVVASLIPAARASRVDVLQALRSD